jgi:hypothetical protein
MGLLWEGEEDIDGEIGCRTVTERVLYDRPSLMGDMV